MWGFIFHRKTPTNPLSQSVSSVSSVSQLFSCKMDRSGEHYHEFRSPLWESLLDQISHILSFLFVLFAAMFVKRFRDPFLKEIVSFWEAFREGLVRFSGESRSSKNDDF